jgi:hypothetical protein
MHDQLEGESLEAIAGPNALPKKVRRKKFRR